jgi:hypothetical protein
MVRDELQIWRVAENILDKQWWFSYSTGPWTIEFHKAER